MEYYPSLQQTYERYTLLVKLDKEAMAQVSGDLFPADNVQSSLYSLLSGGGAYLSFNTHNPILHFFSNPINPTGRRTNGHGMEGDYEYDVKMERAFAPTKYTLTSGNDDDGRYSKSWKV